MQISTLTSLLAGLAQTAVMGCGSRARAVLTLARSEASVAAVVLALLSAGCLPELTPASQFRTGLSGNYVVPAATTAASGKASVTPLGSGLSYTVEVGGLSGIATASRVHIAASGANGPVRFNLCGASGVPTCASTTGGTIVSRTGTAANLVGGITIDSLVSAIRARNAYVDVHTAANPDGEIRGQLFPYVCVPGGGPYGDQSCTSEGVPYGLLTAYHWWPPKVMS
jgi:hypothetical protein